MKSNGNNYCVILAGGKGRRLWPCSRSNYPKQFVDFFGVGRTQLQQTFDRMAKIVPADHIFINTNEEYVQLVKEQLPEVPAERILAEPIHRNTAPSMAWANHRISMLNPDACIIATPSDQAIFNEDAFRENVLEGLAFVAEHDQPVLNLDMDIFRWVKLSATDCTRCSRLQRNRKESLPRFL